MKTKEMIHIALMAALISVSAPLSIPIGNVPISLATLTIMLSGALFGRKIGALSTILYILLGIIGIPVFAGYSSGIGVILGMTGGYVVGYIPLAYLSGLFAELGKNKTGIKQLFIQFTGMILGTLVLYIIGTIYFEYIMQLPLWSALMACVIPFLPGDLVKMILVVILSKRLKQLKK